MAVAKSRIVSVPMSPRERRKTRRSGPSCSAALLKRGAYQRTSAFVGFPKKPRLRRFARVKLARRQIRHSRRPSG
jgi:hypothetical protein